MKVYQVCVGEYPDEEDAVLYENYDPRCVEIGCFLNRDDAQKCVDWCKQRMDEGRLPYTYACVDVFEIEDLETVMKRLEKMCKSEDESR